MPQAENPPAPPAKPVTSYRALGWFWGCVLAILGGGALGVQLMGPPPKPGASPDQTVDATPAPAPGSAPSVAAPAIRKPLAAPVVPVIAPPDPALLEPAPDFPGRNLPISAAGKQPMSVYAAPFDPAEKRPRVALVIAGAGLDQDQTLHALHDLPPAIDIAFSPYMPEELDDQMAAVARQTGHECLQSIPMEPSEYPLSEEGARSLLTGADQEQNRQNLEWALSRMPACAGATGASDGLFGERYAQTAAAFADLLADVTKRGLLYLDPRTGAPPLADKTGVNLRVSDLVVDQAPNRDQPLTAEMIDQRLATLERLATERGSAIGLAGPPKPVMLERIAVWAHGLAARGVALVPVTGIAPPPQPPPETP